MPAWPDLDAPLDPAVAAALRAAHRRGARLLSICSGAFALAGGRAAGRPAGHHALAVRRPAGRAGSPGCALERDVLYVADGPVLTSAGAAAGIDACLHLVRLVHGSATANALARRMVVPAHRDGGQAQYVEIPLPPPSGPPGWAGCSTGRSSTSTSR